jgi:hypothetical protein
MWKQTRFLSYITVKRVFARKKRNEKVKKVRGKNPCLSFLKYVVLLKLKVQRNV